MKKLLLLILIGLSTFQVEARTEEEILARMAEINAEIKTNKDASKLVALASELIALTDELRGLIPEPTPRPPQ